MATGGLIAVALPSERLAADLSVVMAALAAGIAVASARELWRASPVISVWMTDLVTPLLRAGSEGYAPSSSERRRLAIAAALVLALAGSWLAGPLPALPLAIAAPAGVSWIVGARQDRYRRRIERELPALATTIADGLAAGRSLRAALADGAELRDGAAATELARVACDLELGASVERALSSLASRVESRRIDGFCAALVSQSLAGGDLISILRRFADAARSRARVEADARVATAQARFTGLLVVAMPVGAGLLAELAAPGFAAGIAAEPVALVMLGLAVVLQLVGFVAIRHFSRVAGR